MASLNAISEALQKGKADEVKNLVSQALEEKMGALGAVLRHSRKTKKRTPAGTSTIYK